MKYIIAEYIKEEVNALQNLDCDKVDAILESIASAYRTGGRVYLMGNGGSSANASHWVNDLKKNLRNINNGFDVVCLTDNVPLFTAYSNDVAYEDSFLEQIKGRIRQEDVVIALSVSGNSPNLVRAFQYAKEVNCRTISIIADYNGALMKLSDIVLVIGTKNYGIAEDIQQAIDHILVQAIKEHPVMMTREENVC